jgi:PAS domain S-box-containing protein
MPLKTAPRTQRDLASENDELRARLEEAEETLRAIRGGEVDALVVSTADGDRIFTLEGADRSYRALIEEMNEGALSLTLDGTILYANHKFAAMLKAPLERVIGSAIQTWIAPDSRETLELVLRAGVQDKSRMELTLAAADGNHVPVYLSVTPMRAEGMSDILGIVATDLTERKRADEALRLSEARFRNVFQNASLGKSIASMQGEVEVNSALLRILGYSREELQSKDWNEITHPEDIPATENALKGLLAGHLAGVRFEKRFLHKNGSVVWADVTMGLVRDADGAPLYVLTSIYDITARKQADAALQDLKQRLQRNIEMERLRLAQDLHDVPLQQLYGVIFRLDELRPNALPENAAVIDEVIADVKKTLTSLRAIASELRPPDITEFGLEKAARSYIHEFREKYPGIQVKASLATDGQMLPEAVRLVLFRVLQEALANVVRHAEADEIAVRLSFDAEAAHLKISDNGKGFAVPEDWVGLVRAGHYGLAGMAERVSTAGGVFTIESTPGSSTTVRVSMPFGPQQAPALAEKPSMSKPAN